MISVERINIKETSRSRIKELDFNKIPFGEIFSDHMFIANFREGQWGDMRIVPYEHLSISPASPAIHYGQSIFEGIKAYKNDNDEVLLFRPEDNWKRMNRSAERMCMPTLPEEIFMEGLCELLNFDRSWVPSVTGSALYIRPVMFSSDECIGVRPSKNFTFMIITCPVGPYYSTPVKIRVESHYTRAIAGGTGCVKTGGNYARSLYPAKLAQNEGYHQLLWTDGKAHKYIEESGTMNIMLVINGTLVTPMLNDSILEGITRDSILALARHWNMNVEERQVSVEELVDGLKSGSVTDAFGMGTAATIAHIELIGYEGVDYYLPPVAERTFSNAFLKELDGIKRGHILDLFGWIKKI